MGGTIGMAEAASSADWNHEGRDYWPKQFATCNGKRQSPININNQDVKIETDVNDLMFERYDVVRAHGRFTSYNKSYLPDFLVLILPFCQKKPFWLIKNGTI